MRPRGDYQKVAGEHWRTPKEVWGFPPTGENAVRIRRRLVGANAGVFELESVLEDLTVR